MTNCELALSALLMGIGVWFAVNAKQCLTDALDEYGWPEEKNYE